MQMKYCASVILRPRTMDELTNVAALLLVNNMHHLPNMTCLRLELLVGDSVSDVLQELPAHATSLHV
jgi:hypothetical protein